MICESVMDLKTKFVIVLIALGVAACGRKEPEPARIVQLAVQEPTQPSIPLSARWMIAGQVPGYSAERWYSSDEPHVVDGFIVFHDAKDEKVVKLPVTVVGIYER